MDRNQNIMGVKDNFIHEECMKELDLLYGDKMNKRDRQQNAIQRIEKTIEQHTSGTALTEKILADKKIKKTTEEIEKIRKKDA